MSSALAAHPTRDLPTFADVQAACERLKGVAVVTPLLESPALNARLGGRVLIKAETLQISGSFKFRGAYNRISRLSPQEIAQGVVAYSSGNHAQGVAAAAARVGARALIVMPSDAPAVKIEGVRVLGGEVRLYDRWRESREAIGAEIARDRGSVLVPPFDDFHVIAGQGTAGLELFEQAAALGVEIDQLCCGASGGGLIAGLALAAEALSPRTAVHVVEPATHDDYARSLAEGRRVTHADAGPSFCDSLMSPLPGELTFAINAPRLAGAVGVSDAEVAEAMRVAFSVLKLVVEPGGAVALAALLTGRVKTEGRVTAIVLTGGNVDPRLFARVLQGEI